MHRQNLNICILDYFQRSTVTEFSDLFNSPTLKEFIKNQVWKQKDLYFSLSSKFPLEEVILEIWARDKGRSIFYENEVNKNFPVERRGTGIFEKQTTK